MRINQEISDRRVICVGSLPKEGGLSHARIAKENYRVLGLEFCKRAIAFPAFADAVVSNSQAT
jgi:hypothetical protein